MNNKTKKIKGIIVSDITDILTDLQAYENVDATISEKTMTTVCGLIRLAKAELEYGFVNEAVKEVEEQYMFN